MVEPDRPDRRHLGISSGIDRGIGESDLMPRNQRINHLGLKDEALDLAHVLYEQAAQEEESPDLMGSIQAVGEIEGSIERRYAHLSGSQERYDNREVARQVFDEGVDVLPMVLAMIWRAEDEMRVSMVDNIEKGHPWVLGKKRASDGCYLVLDNGDMLTIQQEDVVGSNNVAIVVSLDVMENEPLKAFGEYMEDMDRVEELMGVLEGWDDERVFDIAVRKMLEPHRHKMTGWAVRVLKTDQARGDLLKALAGVVEADESEFEFSDEQTEWVLKDFDTHEIALRRKDQPGGGECWTMEIVVKEDQESELRERALQKLDERIKDEFVAAVMRSREGDGYSLPLIDKPRLVQHMQLNVPLCTELLGKGGGKVMYRLDILLGMLAEEFEVDRCMEQIELQESLPEDGDVIVFRHEIGEPTPLFRIGDMDAYLEFRRDNRFGGPRIVWTGFWLGPKTTKVGE